MVEFLTEIAIIVAESVGILGGLLALYHVTEGPAETILSLLGSVFMGFACLALFVSLGRGARSLTWRVLPRRRQPDTEVDPEKKKLREQRVRAMRGVAGLFIVVAVCTFTLAIISASQPNVAPEEFKRQPMVVVCTWVIYIAEMLVESTLLVRAMYWDVKLEESSRLYAIGPLVPMLGITLIMVDFVFEPTFAPFAAIGLIVGAVGVGLNIALMLFRIGLVIRSRRRRRRA